MFSSKVIALVGVALLWSSPAWAVARTGSGAGTTSFTFSATATGDLKIIFAYDSGARTIPTLPSGWTSIATGQTSTGGTTGAYRVGCNVSSGSGDTTSGTWTSATNIAGVSYSGTAVGTTANCNTTGIGANGTNNAKTSTTITFGATGGGSLTLNVTDGSSWVFGGAGSSTSAAACSPSGLAQVATNGAGPTATANDTNAAIGSPFTAKTCTISSGTWMSWEGEILAVVQAAVSYSPVAGTYTSTQNVTISGGTASPTYCYTTDGTTPTANQGTCTAGTTYSSAVSISTTKTLKAIASKSGYANSALQSGLYTINLPGSFIGYLTMQGVGGVGSSSSVTWTVLHVGHNDSNLDPTNCSATGASCIVTVTSTTSGNLLVAIGGTGNTTANSMASTTPASTHCSNCNVTDSGGLGMMDGSYILSNGGGVTSFTCTWNVNAANGAFCDVYEVSRSTGTASFDVSGNTTTNQSVNCTSCTAVGLTLTGSSDFIAQDVDINNTPSSPSGGYVLETNKFTMSVVNASSGTAPTVTQTPTGHAMFNAMAFK